VAHLLDNLSALDVQLTEADLREIEAAFPASEVKGDRYPPQGMISLNA